MSTKQRLLQFKIHGMDCVEEVAILKREVGTIVGGEDLLSFDILNGKMTVQAAPSGVAPETIMRAVTQAGMRAETWRDERRNEVARGAWQRYRRTIATALGGLFALAGFLAHVVLAGGLRTAIGSEGLGVVHEVPWVARVQGATVVRAETPVLLMCSAPKEPLCARVGW